MDTEGHRRSDNFEDCGAGGARHAAGGMLPALFGGLLRMLGVRGTLILVAVVGGIYFFAPDGIKQASFGLLSGGDPAASNAGRPGGGSVCAGSPALGKACDFSRVVLASTEDVWASSFAKGALPNYDAAPRRIASRRWSSSPVASQPAAAATLVGSRPVLLSGRPEALHRPELLRHDGEAAAGPGRFRAGVRDRPRGRPSRSELFGANRVRAPAKTKPDIGAARAAGRLPGGCLGPHGARLPVDRRQDLREALVAAHNIGDDALGHRNEATFTHGSSQQRMRWFKRGFDTGDARRCDTFAVAPGAL